MPPRDGNRSSGGDFAQDVMIARRRWFHRIDTFRAIETPAADRLRASFGELGTVGVARSLFELSRTILSDEARSLKNGHAEDTGTIPPVEATRSRRRRNRRTEVAGIVAKLEIARIMRERIGDIGRNVVVSHRLRTRSGRFRPAPRYAAGFAATHEVFRRFPARIGRGAADGV